MTETDKAGLRRRLRAARRAIGAGEREAAALAVDATLMRMGLPRPGSRIAAYRAMDGEIDPLPVVQRAIASGCTVHFPVIENFRGARMRFAEPAGDGFASGNASRWLDLVLVPLVGFDADGRRLGMGAGFYDRHFAFLRHRRTWRRPRLLGLAFDLQRVPHLPADAHDVPLWGIVTERRVYGRAGAAR
ncbi:MAG: 5-formyltetrahydrofolate cyclo-ligase [Gammaproteobacteria bacterium]